MISYTLILNEIEKFLRVQRMRVTYARSLLCMCARQVNATRLFCGAREQERQPLTLGYPRGRPSILTFGKSAGSGSGVECRGRMSQLISGEHG